MRRARMSSGKKADVQLSIRAEQGDDGHWSVEIDAEHWVDGVGDQLPPGVPYAVAKAVMQMSASNSAEKIAAQAVANTVDQVIRNLQSRMIKR